MKFHLIFVKIDICSGSRSRGSPATFEPCSNPIYRVAEGKQYGGSPATFFMAEKSEEISNLQQNNHFLYMNWCLDSIVQVQRTSRERGRARRVRRIGFQGLPTGVPGSGSPDQGPQTPVDLGRPSILDELSGKEKSDEIWKYSLGSKILVFTSFGAENISQIRS